MARKKSPYYDGFVAMNSYCCKAAQTLQEVLNDFKPEVLSQKQEAMHTIEHEADNEKHKMMEQLAREFITPIEREDIIELAQAIDDVTDSIEDVLMRMYMYHMQEVRPEAKQFAQLIFKCCENLQQVLEEFHNFRKDTKIHVLVVEVNSLEEEGDRLYVSTVHQLYGEDGEPSVKIGWVRTFDCLEECCDACEHVANLVESIIMKNT